LSYTGKGLSRVLAFYRFALNSVKLGWRVWRGTNSICLMFNYLHDWGLFDWAKSAQ